MESSRSRNMACAVILSLSVGRVLAHDAWLEPQEFARRSGDVAEFDLTSGHGFPEAEHAIARERLARAECRVAGKPQRMHPASVQPKSLRLAVRLQQEGTAVCRVELKPRSIELTEEQVAAYFDEIDAPDAIRRDWAAAPRPRAWRETYAKYAKSMVGSGADKLLVVGAFVCLAGPAFTRPVGTTRTFQVSAVTPWMSIVVLSRELLVTSLRGLIESRGGYFAANWARKAKMILQSVTVPTIIELIALFETGLGAPARTLIQWLVWVTIAATIVSGVPYVFRAMAQLLAPVRPVAGVGE